jgi:uncharacterized protein
MTAMTAFLVLCAFPVLALSAETTHDYPVQPVPFTDVKIQDQFWLPRIETNRTVTIPFAFGKCEETGRVDNFSLAGGSIQGEHKGDFPFDDTDVYKILEGAAYCLSVQYDAKLDAYLDDIIALIAAAQEEDGYLYTCRTNQCDRLRNWMGDQRWEKLSGSHEMYNAGHMYEAAVAHYLATGKRTLLDVALKNADLMVKTFGEDKLRIPPGHQIIEMGLARLFRVTGNEAYLNLARFLLEERGHENKGRKLWGEYSQDHKPVVDQDEAVGHAVRATYMYAGMADVAALAGDERYIHAINRIWDNIVSKKLYITGGVGATGHGEAFGKNYELPNLSAYCETCAAIGHVYMNHRLFLLHADAKYIDVLERSLYNGVISGVSLDGKTFFYPNPLESQGQHERSPWFGCACCPGNITRFMASVPGYMYAVKDNTLFVNLFSESEAAITLPAGQVTVSQQTRYPWDGDCAITVNPEKKSTFDIKIRIPGWARNQPVPSDLYAFVTNDTQKPTLSVNGHKQNIHIQNGYATIHRTWQSGDTVRVRFPMPVRRVTAHDKVTNNHGKVALQRGPLVYCLEWPDHKNARVLNKVLPDNAALRTHFNQSMFGGITVIQADGLAVAFDENSKPVTNPQSITAIPYYAWAHRGKGEMAVWIARDAQYATPLAGPTIANRSRLTTSGGRNPQALKDQQNPRTSDDHNVPFFHWWPKKGTAEWVEFEFDKPEEISSVQVYWFDDTGIGECRLPASWKIKVLHNDDFVPVYTNDAYGTAKDTFNKITFEAVKTRKLKIEVQLPDNFSAGIHEVIIE